MPSDEAPRRSKYRLEIDTSLHIEDLVDHTVSRVGVVGFEQGRWQSDNVLLTASVLEASRGVRRRVQLVMLCEEEDEIAREEIAELVGACFATEAGDAQLFDGDDAILQRRAGRVSFVAGHALWNAERVHRVKSKA